MWKKISLVALVALCVCCLLTACAKEEQNGDSSSSLESSESTLESSDNTLEESKAPVAERFAIAALTANADEVEACVYPEMAEIFVETYAEGKYVFSDVTATASEEIVLLQDGLEYYTSFLSRDYGVQQNLDSASSFTVNFSGKYNGKTYSGSMTVMVADFAGGRYVISAQIDKLEDAFYEDNCPEGEFYFDMHGEE